MHRKRLYSFVMILDVYLVFLLEPNIPPKVVSVTRLCPSTMVVSWTPLSYAEARGFISHYTVAYSPKVTSGLLESMFHNVPGMDSNVTMIEGLDPRIDYMIQVSAVNSAGINGFSPIIDVPASAAAEVQGLISIIICM